MKNWLTTEEASRICNIDQTLLRSWIRTKRFFPEKKIEENKSYFLRKDVLALKKELEKERKTINDLNLITYSEAAEIIEITGHSVGSLCAIGKLEKFKFPYDVNRYVKKEEVLAYGKAHGKFISVSEASAFLKISLNCVENCTKKGYLNAFCVIDGAKYFKPAEIDRFMKSKAYKVILAEKRKSRKKLNAGFDAHPENWIEMSKSILKFFEDDLLKHMETDRSGALKEAEKYAKSEDFAILSLGVVDPDYAVRKWAHGERIFS